MKTPEDKALELITHWLSEVDPQVFMEEFNSLGKGKGITIGEYLAQSEFQYADLEHEHEKSSDCKFVTLLESDRFRQCEFSRNSSVLDQYASIANHWVIASNKYAIPIVKINHHRNSNFSRLFHPVVMEFFPVSAASQHNFIGCLRKISEDLTSFVNKTCSSYNYNLKEDYSPTAQSPISRAS